MLTASRRFLLAAVLAAAALLIGGCWDRREIEERGIVSGVAIDHAQGDKFARATQAAGRQKYRITIEMPNPYSFKNEIGSGGGSSGGRKGQIYAAEGESMFAATRSINARIIRALFFEDVQIMIFSRSVAEEGITDILDFWVRNPQMRRRIQLFVASEGKADKFFHIKLQTQDMNSFYLAQIMRNVAKSPFFASKVELGKISAAVRSGRSFGLPLIVADETGPNGASQVRVTGAAIFRKGKMIGTLNEPEVVGVKILNDNLKQGVTVIVNPEDPDKYLAFNLSHADIKIRSSLDGGRPRLVLTAKFSGDLEEITGAPAKVWDKQFLQAAQENIRQEYRREILSAYARLQELRADVCRLDDVFRREHYRYWQDIKDRWDDEIFPTVKLDLDISVTIAGTGMAK